MPEIPPLLIAVLSDTHDRLPDDLPSRFADADEIWHLGDVADHATIEPIEALGKPLLIVEGNCDAPGHWPRTRLVEKRGSVFQLQHRPPRQIPEEVDAVLFGHLHHPVNERRNGVRLLNPGAISGPRHGSAASFAWLKIDANGRWTWDLELI